MKNQTKGLLLWGVIMLLVFLVYNGLDSFGVMDREQKLIFSDFLHEVENKQVSEVNISGNSIEGKMIDGSRFTTYSPGYPDLVKVLQENEIAVSAAPQGSKMGFLVSVLISWLPMLLLIGFSMYALRQMQGGGRGFGLGRSKVKLNDNTGKKVTFKDVAGIDEAKAELTEIVEFLRNPGKFQKLGGKIPKGCLLIGPPGTGKTLLARAIAGEANVPFFSISGSDFVEVFVGVGASRMRDMFEQGKRNAPCIIFIDEIDAVGRSRGPGHGGGHDEREQTLNQMLVEMDGFNSGEGVIIIAATNRPDVLDNALTRPGRFDRQVVITNPDVDGREQILKVHMQKIRRSKSIDARIIARGTSGFSGAELANLVNEAALIAGRRGAREVTMEHFDDAKDKVLMGIERKSSAMTDDQKKLTAYHEGGHALVGIYAPAQHPIHKATIIPRGRALGMVQYLPERDQYSMTLEEMHSNIATAMAGRVAEEMIFGKAKVTSGASQDIKQATSIARAMVREWGLSDKIGPIFYSGSGNKVFEQDGTPPESDYISKIIDEEVQKIVEQGYQFAKHILSEHKEELHRLASALLEHETLTGAQVKNVVSGRELDSDEEYTFPEPKYVASLQKKFMLPAKKTAKK